MEIEIKTFCADIICPDCKEKQWSISDKNYVALFATCWSCDNKRCRDEKTLSLEKFEEREKLAVGTKLYEINILKKSKI